MYHTHTHTHTHTGSWRHSIIRHSFAALSLLPSSLYSFFIFTRCNSILDLNYWLDTLTRVDCVSSFQLPHYPLTFFSLFLNCPLGEIKLASNLLESNASPLLINPLSSSYTGSFFLHNTIMGKPSLGEILLPYLADLVLLAPLPYVQLLFYFASGSRTLDPTGLPKLMHLFPEFLFMLRVTSLSFLLFIGLPLASFSFLQNFCKSFRRFIYSAYFSSGLILLKMLTLWR